MDIYLDYAANTPVDTKVLDVFNEICLKYYANPNSMHDLGKEANLLIKESTEQMLNMLNLDTLQIDTIYTASASEANNLAIKGVARTYRQNGKHIISTCLEHNSVSGALSFLQEQGYEVDLVDIKKDGTIDLEHFKDLIREDTILVSICYVDSELGVVQPINKIKEIVKNYENCYLHVDATQAVAKTMFNFLDIDLVSFAPHKFYGLNGIGILLKRKDIILEPLISGGTGNNLYRSGTPFLPIIKSSEKALEIALNLFDERTELVKSLREIIINEFKNLDLVRINSTEKSVDYILNVSIKNVKSKIIQEELSKNCIFVSTKSACSSTNSPSRAVYAVSKDKKNAMSSWRISLSHLTTYEQINIFLEKFKKIYFRLT